jgi:hypothetical protein
MTDTPSAILTADELSSTLRGAGFLTRFSLLNSGFSGIQIRSGEVTINSSDHNKIISMGSSMSLSIDSNIINRNQSITIIIANGSTSKNYNLHMDEIPSKLPAHDDTMSPGEVIKYSFSFPPNQSGSIMSSKPFVII